MSLGQDFADALHRIGRDSEMDSIRAAAGLVAPLHGPPRRTMASRSRGTCNTVRTRATGWTVFRPADQAGEPRPVLVFVHGGGFIGGDKSMPGRALYDNVGVWAARRGMVGINITYRLAPQHKWPAGSEDVAGGDRLGEDPCRRSTAAIQGASSSPGHRPAPCTWPAIWRGPIGAEGEVAGAILLSCLFDMPTCDKNPLLTAYFGDDATKYPQQSTLAALARTPVPVLVTLAEFDPVDFERQTLAYVNAYFAARGEWPNLIRGDGPQPFHHRLAHRHGRRRPGRPDAGVHRPQGPADGLNLRPSGPPPRSPGVWRGLW